MTTRPALQKKNAKRSPAEWSEDTRQYQKAA